MSTLALRSDAGASVISLETAIEVGHQLPAAHVFAGLKARHYRCVLVDPPSAFLAGTKGRPQHYARMSDREIAALPVADLLHPDGAWIFLWVTSPKLFPPPGSGQLLSPADIVRQWGAKYSARAFVWVKTKKSAAKAAIRSDHRHPASRSRLHHAQERRGLPAFQGRHSKAPRRGC